MNLVLQGGLKRGLDIDDTPVGATFFSYIDAAGYAADKPLDVHFMLERV